MILLFACAPSPLPFERLSEVELDRIRDDADYRAAVLSIANDPETPHWHVAAGLVAEADAPSARSDVLPAMRRRWDASMDLGLADVDAWMYLVRLCAVEHGCDADGRACPADAPATCRLVDRDWLGCPAERTRPMRCVPARGWRAEGWIPEPMVEIPATRGAGSR
jgi:hypothetical protein